MSEIVVVGSLNIDMVIKIPRRPNKGETLLGKDLLITPGGKGANQAFAAGNLGGKVTMIGCIGDDLFAQKLTLQLEGAHVDTAELETINNCPSGTALITIDQDGDNSIIVAPGANEMLTPSIIQKKEHVIRQAKIVVVQLEIPLETVIETIHIAHKYGVPILLDPAPAQALSEDILSKVDYITPNETEIFQLTGIQVTDKTTAEAAAKKLLNKGVKTVFAKMGAKGVTVVTEDESNFVEGHNVIAIDTTAAGDSFAGAIATALVEGMDVMEAAKFGNAVGALTVTKLGAQSSIPSRQQVDKFIR